MIPEIVGGCPLLIASESAAGTLEFPLFRSSAFLASHVEREVAALFDDA